MFDTLGFISDKAPLLIDIVALYFALFPFLLFAAVRLAAKGAYTAHARAQIALFALSMIMVILFEVTVRILGSFTRFLESAAVDPLIFILFLVIHIITALAALMLWSYQIFASVKANSRNAFAPFAARHKRLGSLFVLLMGITLLQGALIYYWLFIL